jgi:HEAT repeat protein
MDKALGDKSPRVREAALAGMTAAGRIPPASMGRVTKLLASDKWTFVRISAAQALAREPAGGAPDKALIAALQDDSNKVRRAVLRSLGDRKTQAAGEKIHDIADNAKEPTSVRTAAVVALGSLCRYDSVELLYKLALRAGYQQLPYDQPIGLAALAALGELKPPDIAERLAPLVKQNERVPRVIRSIARDVLSRTGTCK